MTDASQPQPSAASPASPVHSERTRAPLATAALIVALAIPALGLVFRVVSASVIVSGGFTMASAVAVVEGLVTLLVAVAAGILGIICLVRGGAGRARAAAALAIAALSLWGVVLGFLNGVFISAFAY